MLQTGRIARRRRMLINRQTLLVRQRRRSFPSGEKETLFLGKAAAAYRGRRRVEVAQMCSASPEIDRGTSGGESDAHASQQTAGGPSRKTGSDSTEKHSLHIIAETVLKLAECYLVVAAIAGGIRVLIDKKEDVIRYLEGRTGLLGLLGKLGDGSVDFMVFMLSFFGLVCLLFAAFLLFFMLRPLAKKMLCGEIFLYVFSMAIGFGGGIVVFALVGVLSGLICA